MISSVILHCSGLEKCFDSDNPSGTGRDPHERIHTENPGKICKTPVDIEVRTFSGQSVKEAGDKIFK